MKTISKPIERKTSLAEKDFMSVRASRLYRVYSAFTNQKLLTPKMSELSSFDKEEVEYVRGIAKEISDSNARFKLHELPIDYTTQPPYYRNQLIGLTSDLSKIKVAPWDPEVWQKISIAMSAPGSAQVASGPANLTEFIEFAQQTKRDQPHSVWAELSAFIEKMLPESYLSFVSRIDFNDKILERMNDDLVEKKGIYAKNPIHPAIYRKLKADLDFMKEMKDFIIHQVTNISGYREERDSFMQILVMLKENLINAIKNTNTRDNYDRFIRGLKLVGSSVVIGTATWISAKTQIIGLFSSFTQYPELVYVAAVGAAVFAAFIMDATINRRKAARENHLTRKYDRKMRKIMDEVKEYVRTYLKLVGFKATKEMAEFGYLEALQGDVSDAYFTAAYKGDFGTLNSIYAQQVKDTLGSGWFSWISKMTRSVFSHSYRDQVYYDDKIGLAATTSDGYAKPPANGNGLHASD